MKGVGGKATVGISIFTQCFRDFSFFDVSIMYCDLLWRKRLCETEGSREVDV